MKRVPAGNRKVRAIPPGEYEPLKQEMDRLKAELALARADKRKLQAQAHAQDRIVEYAQLHIDAMRPVPPPKPPKPRALRGKTQESLVVGCACWHVGEDINAAEMGGLNAYNFDIFCARLQLMVDKIVRFTVENMTGYNFTELHVLHLGDFVSGVIHELAESNGLNIVEQVHLGALVTAQALQELAQVYPRVIFTGVSGNHGRFKPKPYSKRAQQCNWDYIAYNYMATLLRNQPNIKFNIPLSPWAGITIQGFNFHMMHGNQIRSQFSIPHYGLHRDAAKWIEIGAYEGKFYKYFIRSHFHTKLATQTTLGENFLIASLKGACEHGVQYGLNEPIQTLFGVHPHHGKTWELPLNLQTVDTKSRYKYRRDVSLAEQMDLVM